MKDCGSLGRGCEVEPSPLIKTHGRLPLECSSVLVYAVCQAGSTYSKSVCESSQTCTVSALSFSHCLTCVDNMTFALIELPSLLSVITKTFSPGRSIAWLRFQSFAGLRKARAKRSSAIPYLMVEDIGTNPSSPL